MLSTCLETHVSQHVVVGLLWQARLDAAAGVPRALRARAAADYGEDGGGHAGRAEARELRLCLAEVLEREVSQHGFSCQLKMSLLLRACSPAALSFLLLDGESL